MKTNKLQLLGDISVNTLLDYGSYLNGFFGLMVVASDNGTPTSLTSAVGLKAFVAPETERASLVIKVYSRLDLIGFLDALKGFVDSLINVLRGFLTSSFFQGLSTQKSTTRISATFPIRCQRSRLFRIRSRVFGFTDLENRTAGSLLRAFLKGSAFASTCWIWRPTSFLRSRRSSRPCPATNTSRPLFRPIPSRTSRYADFD